jgi:hypothetical protein
MGLVKCEAQTPDEYVASLQEDRREAIAAVRAIILVNLPEGYEEGLQYGMLGWHIPLERYPDTYNGQPLGVAALASQKNYMVSETIARVPPKDFIAAYERSRGK